MLHHHTLHFPVVPMAHALPCHFRPVVAVVPCALWRCCRCLADPTGSLDGLLKAVCTCVRARVCGRARLCVSGGLHLRRARAPMCVSRPCPVSQKAFGFRRTQTACGCRGRNGGWALTPSTAGGLGRPPTAVTEGSGQTGARHFVIFVSHTAGVCLVARSLFIGEWRSSRLCPGRFY